MVLQGGATVKLDDGESIRACPSIWQQQIPKRVEIRATVLGNEVLAAEIHSQQSERSRHGWRNYDFENTPYLQHELPEDVRVKCVRLLRELRLLYVAIDLILTDAGEYYFLEINPFGQWAWIQDLCGLPLAQAHCRLFRQLIDGRFEYGC